MKRIFVIILLLQFTVACANKKEKAIQELKVMKFEYTQEAFTDAAQYASKEILELYLQAGMDPNSVLPDGKPLMAAIVESGWKDKIQILKDAGVSINSAVMYLNNPIKTGLSLYIDKQRSSKQSGALLGRLDDIRALDRLGARSVGGCSALHYLLAPGMKATPSDLQAARKLIETGFDVNAKCEDGVTVMMKAAREVSDIQLLKLLVDKGADVNSASRDGWTAMHYAVVGGDVEVIKFVKHIQKDIKSKNSEGKTPLDLAKENGNQSVISALSSD